MSDDKEKEIKAKYGDVSLESAPVNPDNPTFDSLLGALSGVYSGEFGIDVLIKYHKSLSMQLEDSKKAIQSIEIPEQFKDIAKEQMDIVMGSLDIIQIVLDLIAEYIESPSPDKMADCVEALLNAQHNMKQIENMLDINIWLSEAHKDREEDKSGNN